jgi:hypothetical protein
MMETERGGFQEDPRQINATQMFAGPNDGLSQTCNGVSTFIGLQGHSQKAGYRVIFLTLDMGRYIEIAEADILATEELSPAHSPFGTLGGTRVSVRDAARIITNRAVTRSQEVDDEFDLDIRLGASGWSVPPGMPGGAADEAIYAPGMEGEERQAKPIQTNGACPTEVCPTRITCATCEGTCEGKATCVTCATCGQHTCLTCKGEATCQTCETCQTKCGQETCATCKGEATCQTCETQCKQATCGVTCHTCATCVTCVPEGCIPHTAPNTCCKDTCI